MNRIRFQQGLGTGIGDNQLTGTGLSENDHGPLMEAFAAAATPGSAGMGLDTADFMGMVNLEDFDFADLDSLDPMGLDGLS